MGDVRAGEHTICCGGGRSGNTLIKNKKVSRNATPELAVRGESELATDTAQNRQTDHDSRQALMVFVLKATSP